MTKKDFELIADAIRDARFTAPNTVQDQEVIDLVVNRLVRDLGRANPRFDEAKFRKVSSI